MECYCDARNKPMRCEITKPQTASVISLWFWGLLAYPELYCDWPEHDQHSWKFSGVHGFLSLTVIFRPPHILCIFKIDPPGKVKPLRKLYPPSKLRPQGFSFQKWVVAPLQKPSLPRDVINDRSLSDLLIWIFLTYLHQLSRHIKFCKQNTAMLIVLREI